MERLDHRQLLSVNFTGNVTTDFPVNQTPGVVVLPDNGNVVHPVISDVPVNGVSLKDVIKVSGFDISGLRTVYTPADDTLSIGIEQPPSQQPGQPGPVIAGDADNNGNDGTVNPAVMAIEPGFQDFPNFGGSEYMEVFLDLKGTGQPDIVAGFSQSDPRSPKQYEVADAIVNPNAPTAPPQFGTALPQFTGAYFKANSPLSPNFELSIAHFSQLYLQETGQPLSPSSTVTLGAAAGSAQDLGISEAFFPAQPFTISQATPNPVINILKMTDGQVALTAPGPTVTSGSPVTWTYSVTNPGSESLKNVVVTDDAGTPNNPADDFQPTPVTSGGFNIGDLNHNGLLDPGEDWIYTGQGTAQLGQYENRVVTTGTGVIDNTQVTSNSISHYNGQQPTTPTTCPPASPPVLINPHENRHVNTAHPTDVRVTILGTSGFDVTQIIPASVTLGGAHPIFNYTRNVNRDEWLDETFIFKGTDIHLPPGTQEATVTGNLTGGTTFSSSALIFNRNASFYSPAAVSQAQARQAADPNKIQVPIAVLQARLNAQGTGQANDPNLTGASTPFPAGVGAALTAATASPTTADGTGTVVRIKRREPVASGGKPAARVSSRLRASMNDYLQQPGAGAS